MKISINAGHAQHPENDQQTIVHQYQHQTVLLEEAVTALQLDADRKNGVYVDGTFGRGGHSREILRRLDAKARLIAFDKDPQAILSAQAKEFCHDQRFSIFHHSFADLTHCCDQAQIAQVNGVLLDLGVSSPQIDEAARGFSFRSDGPLDMRMDTTQSMTAASWLANAPEAEIAQVIAEYGEERFARQVAAKIVATRATTPIIRTHQLAQLVAQAVKTRERGQDPATRTFQAIRIFINQELNELSIGLHAAFQRLAPYGRLVVISFHSLEDRIVKRFMQQQAQVAQPDRRLPVFAKDLPKPLAKLLPKVKPSAAEIERNPRARSAWMRVLEKLPDQDVV